MLVSFPDVFGAGAVGTGGGGSVLVVVGSGAVGLEGVPVGAAPVGATEAGVVAGLGADGADGPGDG